MKKLLLLLSVITLTMTGCIQGQSKYQAATQASTAFLQACMYQSIDYQITGDNTKKTYTVTCSVRTNVDSNS
jgi:hypothetical protein